jgi:hypothetical protein
MRRWAEITSFLVGAVAALLLLAGWCVPSAHVNPRTALTVGIAPSQAVELSRTGTILRRRRFAPDTPFSATVELHNSRHARLHLRPRLEIAGDRDAAEALQAEVLAGGERLFQGSAIRLSTATARRLLVRPGGTTTATLRLELPRDEAGTLARTVRLRLVFEVDQ